MNLPAFVESPRTGKATDTLVDNAITGLKSKTPDGNAKKINLIEYDSQYCKNCLLGRDY
ncbi:MAG: hypothetical protein HKM93_08240 [Desulfobacteraceae bacterium]|nr:hypothetical protein [Desulfobacteraceae bacterium]